MKLVPSVLAAAIEILSGKATETRGEASGPTAPEPPCG
jgi:hypothetical protein